MTSGMAAKGKVVLVTGWPGFIGRNLVRSLASRLDPVGDRLLLFTREHRVEAARAEIQKLGIPGDAVEGDVAKMHLGLSGGEYKQLVAKTTEIWHLAALHDLGPDPKAMEAVNLDGTRHVLELARDAPSLERLHYFSSAYVSGDREGVILEEELEMGQRFRDLHELSKFNAERLVRQAMEELAVTVYRPSTVVGDSRTGEVDRFDGPYYLAVLLVTSPLALPLPLPGNALAPLHLVPVDFVVDAALSIGANPAAIGKTVHLVDPNPLSARKIYELIAAREGKRLPPSLLPHRTLEALLSLPIIERLARPHRDAVRLVNRFTTYNCRNQLELLAGTGIRCPPITSYLDTLLDFVKQHYASSARGRQMEDDADDPLDPPPGTPAGR